MSDAQNIWDHAVEHSQRLSNLNSFLEKNDVKVDFNELVELDAELMKQINKKSSINNSK